MAGGSNPQNLLLEISKVLATFSELFEVYFYTNFLTTFNSDPRFHSCKIGPLLDELSKNANLVLMKSSTSSLEFIARRFVWGLPVKLKIRNSITTG